ncbi:MAG TPA: hypothetical protein VNK26_00650 [Pyrinomonadaceae bacterium]|nr:hypothetical protein [Pyrinomonadaceae bacterium]
MGSKKDLVTLEQIRKDFTDNWISEIYLKRVRQGRTRRITLPVPQKENKATILHTLLGIDLKVGRSRIFCPDLATARYLSVFARIGCREVAVPYDITKISLIADELETSWQRLLLILNNHPPRIRTKIISGLRAEIEKIGPGDLMPEFNTPTRRLKR